MKNILKYSVYALLAIGLGMTATGCEDFLDRPTRGKTAAEEFFKDAVQARMAVYGVYQQLASKYLYSERGAVYYHMETDESRIASSSKNTNDWRSIARYGQSPSNAEIFEIYANYYKLIERANDCLESIAAMEQWVAEDGFEQTEPSATLTELRRLWAEALFLRAIAYNDLIGFFGDVPLKLTSSKVGDDFDMPRTDRDEIYDILLADLDKYVDWLPWRGDVPDQERITRGAAKGFIARFALRAAGFALRWDTETYSVASLANRTRADVERLPELYQLAKRHAGDVIASNKHSLNPDYKSIFVDLLNSKTDTYGERMFEVALFETVSGGGVIGAYNSPKIAYSATGKHPYGEGKGYVQSLPGYYYSFAPGDVRGPVTNVPLNMDESGKLIASTLASASCGKFRRWWINGSAKSRNNTDVNWCLLRYSDVLLMYAEASWWLRNEGNRSGNLVDADALEGFNKVRRRGFGLPVGTPSVTVDLTNLTFDDIVDERSFELGHEGVRKWDLFRWGIMAAKLQQARLDMKAIQDNAYDPRHNPTIAGNLTRYAWYKSSSLIADEAGTQIVFTDPSDNTFTRVNWALQSMSDSEVNLTNDPARRGVARYWQDLRSELLPMPRKVLENSKRLRQTPPYAAGGDDPIFDE